MGSIFLAFFVDFSRSTNVLTCDMGSARDLTAGEKRTDGGARSAVSTSGIPE